MFITDAIAEPVAGKRVGYARRNVVVDKSAKHVCIEGSDVMAGKGVEVAMVALRPSQSVSYVSTHAARPLRPHTQGAVARCMAPLWSWCRLTQGPLVTRSPCAPPILHALLACTMLAL